MVTAAVSLPVPYLARIKGMSYHTNTTSLHGQIDHLELHRNTPIMLRKKEV